MISPFKLLCITLFALAMSVCPWRVSHAKDVCAAYRNTAPLPSWYPEYCNKDGSSKTRVGGAFSSFADSFNLNPASIPTESLPMGLEYISSFRAGSYDSIRNNFALIKGFQRIGAGFSTNSDDTFYSNSLMNRIQGTSFESLVPGVIAPNAIAPTFNIGSAVALLPPEAKSIFSPNLGAMLRYNKYNQKWSPGAGISFNSDKFTFGLSLVRESGDTYTPPTTFHTFTAGAKLGQVQLEYVYLKNSYQFTSSDPIHIGTISGNWRGVLLTGAIRRLVNLESNTVFQGHFAAQYQFSSHLAAGYMYNYIPGFHSLGVQVFL